VILNKSESGGGSTITQQLAKLLYSPHANNKLQRIFQKPVEWVIAAKLERFYSKDEIINLYLNKYDFNYNAVGIESAAHTYFNKTPGELKVEEAAMLIGMLKNSSLYNPVRRPEITRERRNVVLSQMQKAGHLTKEEADSLKKLPIELDFNRSDHVDIAAPYYRQNLAKMMMAEKPNRKNYASWQRQQFTEDSLSWENNPLYGWCNKNRKPDGSNYNIYTDGLKIYSTINSRMQRHAEAAVREHLGGYLQDQFFREKKGKKYAPYSSEVSDQVESLLTAAMRQTDRYRILKKAGFSEADILKNFKEKPVEMKVFSWDQREVDTVMTPWDSIRYHKYFLRTGFMAMDPFTGHVKAYVGGPDFKFFKYDMVSTGKRQNWSTIEPYLVHTGHGRGNDTLRPDSAPTDHPDHRDRGGMDPTESRPYQRQSGLHQMGTAELQQLGHCLFDEAVFSLCFCTNAAVLRFKDTCDPVVSLALGPNDASVYEMVGATPLSSTAHSGRANAGDPY